MEAADNQEGSIGQQFSDIQNYLVTFNKDIENAGNNSVTVLENSNDANTGSLFAIESRNEGSTTGESVNSTNILSAVDSLPDQDEISQNMVQQSGSQYMVVPSENNSITISQTNMSQSSLQEDIDEKSESVDCLDSESAAQISAVHDHIAHLNGKPLQNFSNQSVETLKINGKEITLNLSQDGSNVLGQVVRMLSVGDGQFQLIGNLTGEQGDNVGSSGRNNDAVIAENIGPNIIRIDRPLPSSTLAAEPNPDNNNPNASNAVQIVTINQHDLNNAQLVALQNSTDSSQPQLVAVQDKDNTNSDKLQINTDDGNAASTSNTVLLNTDNKSYQSDSLPQTNSEEQQEDSEVNYVFVVQPPEEEKEEIQKYLPPGLNIFGPDFNSQDITSEEIIDQDGTVKRVLKINAKKIIGHMQSNTQLMCNYCNYTSPKRYLLTRHLKSHSDDRPHKCQFCKRGFKTVAALQNHVNTHTGVRPHKCKECNSAFTTSGELVRHVRYRHTFEKPHKCSECDYASVELSKLKRHMRSHTGERPYQCTNCSYASPDTYKLKRHMRIHTGEKPYECDICHARFTQSNSLKAHKLIHSGNKPVFQCDLCPTTCGRKTDLKIHMQKLHMSEKPLECRKCGCTFPDRYTYKVHLKTHDGEKCFRCEHCDYAAMSFRHLEVHTLTHSDEKPFECDQCDQTFRQKQLLKRHINLHHTPDYTPPNPKEKSFDCDECDRSFAHKGNLVRHLQQHGSEGENSAGFGSHLLHSNLLADLREGKLGASPQVVIVHPDGRVEEVTQKLQALQEKSDEEVLMSMVNKSISSAKEAVSPDSKKGKPTETSNTENQASNENPASSQETDTSTSQIETSPTSTTANSISSTHTLISQTDNSQIQTDSINSEGIMPVASQYIPATLDQLVNSLPASSTMECSDLPTTVAATSLQAGIMSSSVPSLLNSSVQAIALPQQNVESKNSVIPSSLVSNPVTVSRQVASSIDQTREAGTQAELEEIDDDPKNSSSISELATPSDDGFATESIIAGSTASDVTIPLQSIAGSRTIVSHPDGSTQVLVFNLGQDMASHLAEQNINTTTGEVDGQTITYLTNITTQFAEAGQPDLSMASVSGNSDATFSPLQVGLVQLEQDDGIPLAKKQRVE